MSHCSRRAIAALAAIAAACTSPQPIGEWTAFGRSLAADHAMPSATLPRARAIASALADELDRRGIAPNFDANGRERARREFDDERIGTCGHLAGVLGDALRAAGVPPAAIHVLVAVRMRPSFGNRPSIDLGRDWLNADHAAVLVVADGEALVFDPWWHGREHGAFAAFGDSESCGMPAPAWLARMQRDRSHERQLDAFVEDQRGLQPGIGQERLVAKLRQSGAVLRHRTISCRSTEVRR